ncbi:hypothetical protein ACFLSF_03810 [Candidatus Bipolaricaulota bacterium]
MNRSRAAVLAIALLVGLVGCTQLGSDPVLTVTIDPEQGIVPFTAQIIADAPPGSFTFELPNATVEVADGVLEVLVDDLEWTAMITWTDGETVERVAVTAWGMNAPPSIWPPLINGMPNLWNLEPRERTVIDFSSRPSTLTAPRTGVEYSGPWVITGIAVECSKKLLCGQLVSDSVYYPPYDDGAIHALLNGYIHENACIVYPTCTFEIAPNGLPYSPAAEEGYTYDGLRHRNAFFGVQLPAQSATISVTVSDEFGRLTTAKFEIPVGPLLFGTDYGDATQFSEAWYFVANEDETIFHEPWCREVCLIPSEKRIYFSEMRNAIESGRQICPLCSGEQAASSLR